MMELETRRQSPSLALVPGLRPYQSDAADAAIAWMKKSVMPGLLELCTSAGKSWILAALALWVHKTNSKRVLCLQPSVELVEQNHEKYTATGHPASIFSAAAGSKDMRHPVVFATPGSVKNALSRFGDEFGAVYIDEAQGTTPTIRAIIEHMRTKNPRLRVIGTTGTPYVMKYGYIYQYDVDGSFMPEEVCREPYYNTLLYKIQTNELMDMGFLTPVNADPDHAAGYDAKGMKLNKQGKFDDADLNRVFVGKGRLTSEIVADIVARSHDRRGVMIFAATVQHAKEIMESLPPDNSRMVAGDVNMKKTKEGDNSRSTVIKAFKRQEFKFLVSVGALAVGFDAPHVDVIALLRLTESPGLLQQIIGRMLRLFEGKTDGLLLDYAGNIEFHGLQENLFKPEIRAAYKSGESVSIPANCEACGYQNIFSARKNDDQFGIDDAGYFLDAMGKRIETDHGPMPAHYGRRCTGQVRSMVEIGTYERCEHRWTSKPCFECEHPNDIAAKYCESCKAELVDPNEKLRREFIRVKKDPDSLSTDEVKAWYPRLHTTKKGAVIIACDYETEYRKFTMYYDPASVFSKQRAAWDTLCRAVYSGHIAPDAETFFKYLDRGKQPVTITYKRQKDSTFFEVFDHNRPADVCGVNLV